LWCVLLTATVAALLILIAGGPVTRIALGAPQPNELALWLAGVLAVTVVGSYTRQYFRIAGRITLLAVLDTLEAVLELGLIVGVVLSGGGVAEALAGVLAARCLSLCVQLMFVVSAIGLPRPALDWANLGALLVFGLPLVPEALMRWGINFADRFVIIHLLGLGAVGVYSASYSLGMLLYLVAGSLGFVFYPFVLRRWNQGQQDLVRQDFAIVTRYYVVLMVPAAAGLALLSQPILRLLANPAFTTDSLLVFEIALGIVFSGVYQLNVYRFHLHNKPRWVTPILFAGVALNLCLNLVLVPLIGLHGAAVATLVTFLLLYVASAYLARRHAPLAVPAPPWLKTAFATGCMAAVICVLPTNSLPGLVLAVIVGPLVYVPICLLCRTLQWRELQQLLSISKSIPPRQIETPSP
jgi:O-antigen/teichoic acid export membrane protein